MERWKPPFKFQSAVESNLRSQ
ncbi:hypothetical protein CCACVL1_25433 [Corchorus capsularis]|uniref:Uncharacterized protein n=1 Tax=Corchorus capsularis TaxID=210143 RepID=A0A1R3GKF4_COCAP|nr:hypothetical protein CCACVL1_25433 [Corchorus capsularis]